MLQTPQKLEVLMRDGISIGSLPSIPGIVQVRLWEVSRSRVGDGHPEVILPVERARIWLCCQTGPFEEVCHGIAVGLDRE